MKFNQFIKNLKDENQKLKDSQVSGAYLDENIIKVRKRYFYDSRRLDLLVKPLFVQFSLFAEYALNDEISQILSVSKQLINENVINKKNVKNIKNKIIDGYRNFPGVKEETNLSTLGRWKRIEGKISDLSEFPNLFSLMFGFNSIEFFIEKIIVDSNFMEGYLEIILNYYGFHKFENSIQITDFFVIEEQLSRLSYGNKVWLYEVFSPFIKTVFHFLYSILTSKNISDEFLDKGSNLIIWDIIESKSEVETIDSLFKVVDDFINNSKINYRNRDYKFNTVKIENQIKYFLNVSKVRNNIEHTNSMLELLRDINALKEVNEKSPKLLSDINLIDYLPDKSMIELRVDSFIDGLDKEFDPVLGEIYVDVMIESVNNLIGWYKPIRNNINDLLNELNSNENKFKINKKNNGKN